MSKNQISREMQMEKEDQMIRKIMESAPSYLDYEDDTPIACDANGIWYTAKQLKDKEIRENADKPQTE